MKIAFISHEYPPDTAQGGIATYVYQVTRLLQSRGHQVEVFSCSPYRQGTFNEDGILCHRITDVTMTEFGLKIGPIFAARHRDVKFDVIEGSEIEAPARGAVNLVPDIPLVVKLHTPSFLTAKLNRQQLYPGTKVRHTLNLLRQGLNPLDFWVYNLEHDIERCHALEADEIVILTRSILEQVVKPWQLDVTKVSYIPNPYVPAQKLLDIPAETDTNVITFLGRLEARKGVLDVARAIPLILQNHPAAKFRFVGKSRIAPNLKVPMKEHLEEILKKYLDAVEFVDGVSLEEIPEILADTDICVFPSIWENFPNVCLEAMAAARGIVGSQAGGMNEMLNYGLVGALIPPRDPPSLAKATTHLLKHPTQRIKMGLAARNRLREEYNADNIGKEIESSYLRAIQRRQQAGGR
ncbi:MAG: glycosyltransferase family 4 protein [Nodosilinea sp.]